MVFSGFYLSVITLIIFLISWKIAFINVGEKEIE